MLTGQAGCSFPYEYKNAWLGYAPGSGAETSKKGLEAGYAVQTTELRPTNLFKHINVISGFRVTLL